MSPTFKNTFSWSVSRDNVFLECPRKYYFNYYGHWGGWLTDASQRTREIYVLGKLKHRPMWIGQVVHECIARSLQNISRGVPVLETAEILSITRSLMRQNYRQSINKSYWQNPKNNCGFFEHEYDIEVTDEEWRKAADDVDHCLNAFYDSEEYDQLLKTPQENYLEVEQFSSFFVEGVELRIKLDCAVREGENIVIWDWKTGKRESDTGLSLQMACYAAYARDKYRADLDRILTRRFDLFRGIVHEHTATSASLDEVIDYIRGSITDMKALLEDKEENKAIEENFAKVERRNICGRCNYLKVCKPDI